MEENNKLIAIFMGLKYNPITANHGIRDNTWQKGGEVFFELKYHTSWDWLMPVVEKIESIKRTDGAHISQYSFNWVSYIYLHRCWIQNNTTTEDVLEDSCDGETKIEATYNTVVEMIKYLNTQK